MSETHCAISLNGLNIEGGAAQMLMECVQAICIELGVVDMVLERKRKIPAIALSAKLPARKFVDKSMRGDCPAGRAITGLYVWLNGPAHLILCFEGDHVLAPAVLDLVSVRNLLEQCQFDYGYGYEREESKGPTWYAVGVNQGRLEPMARAHHSEDDVYLNVSFWSDASRQLAWRDGLLRNVYQINVLNAWQHTLLTVESQSLRDWIASGAGSRGAYDDLPDGRLVWTVPTEHLIRVRETIWQTGRIWSWVRDIKNIEGHPNLGTFAPPLGLDY